MTVLFSSITSTSNYSALRCVFIESFSKLVNLSTNYVNKAVVTLKSENKIGKKATALEIYLGQEQYLQYTTSICSQQISLVFYACLFWIPTYITKQRHHKKLSGSTLHVTLLRSKNAHKLFCKNCKSSLISPAIFKSQHVYGQGKLKHSKLNWRCLEE